MGKLIPFPKRIKVNREITSKIKRRQSEDRVRKKIIKTSGVDLVAILLGDEKEKRKYEMLMNQHRDLEDDDLEGWPSEDPVECVKEEDDREE